MIFIFHTFVFFQYCIPWYLSCKPLYCKTLYSIILSYKPLYCIALYSMIFVLHTIVLYVIAFHAMQLYRILLSCLSSFVCSSVFQMDSFLSGCGFGGTTSSTSSSSIAKKDSSSAGLKMTSSSSSMATDDSAGKSKRPVRRYIWWWLFRAVRLKR